jgi:hypothetical protein
MESFEAPTLAFLRGGGEMRAFMRDKDWEATPLGVWESCLPALKMVVGLVLANRFPQLLWRGISDRSPHNMTDHDKLILHVKKLRSR